VADDAPKTRSEVLAESRKKGILAGGAAIATGVAVAAVGSVPIAVLGVGATSVLTYRWVKHRLKNGIKF
jgi:hypothetical protein